MMSSASMMQMLQGMQFPMRKEQIIEHLKKQNASSDIMESLKMIPDREYESADSLMKALESTSQMTGGGGKSQSFGGSGHGDTGGGGPSTGGSSQGFGGRGGT